MKKIVLKVLTLVFAFCIAGLVSAQTSLPENWKEVIQKYQNSAFHSLNNPVALSAFADDNLKSSTEIYEVDGFVILEMLIMEWEEGAWVNVMKMVYTYDNNEFLIEMIVYTWIEGAWVNGMKMEYTNNASGAPMEALWYIWNADTQEWDLMMKDTYTYDGNGWLTELLSQMWMMEQWINNDKWLYTYDVNGNCIEELELDWDFMNNVWENFDIHYYTYANNLLMEDLKQMWWNGAWENEYDSFWTYDGGGHYIDKLTKIWENAQWENFLHSVPTYNASWQLTEELGEEWLNGVWENDCMKYYTYDASGNLIEVLEQDWEAKGWVNSDKMIYTYGIVGVDEYSFINSSDFSLMNFPNPFTSVTTISFEINIRCYVQIDIFDLTGKRVNMIVSEEMKPDTYQYIWDGTDSNGNKLGTGLYLYRIKAGGETAVNKLSIIE